MLTFEGCLGAFNRMNIWHSGITAVAAFCTTGTTITLVSLQCNEYLTGSGAQLGKKYYNYCEEGGAEQCV